MIKPANRMESFRKGIFTDLKEEGKKYEAAHGKKTIDFSIGSPDLAPEPDVKTVLQKQAGQDKNYRYAITPLPQLIQAIQDWYRRRYGVDLQEDEIALLQGSQEALVNLPLIFLNPGDGVLIPNPYYPIYEQAPRLAGGEVLFMPLKKENRFLIDLDAIPEEDLKKAKMILVSYPNNPTGAAADDEFYEKLIRFAREHNLLVVHDNAYSDLVFDGKKGKSFLSYPGASEVGIELNSFSKNYGMAGARLGVLAGNKDVVKAYKELKSNLDYGVFLPVQYAGIEALEHGGAGIEENRRTYEHRRNLMVDLFKKAGWDIEPGAGSMFLWAPIPDSYEDSNTFARDLLAKTGLIVTPGLAFGSEGRRFVRIALVENDDAIREAARRLEESEIFRPEK